jgi:hypothetical protein
MSGTTAPHISWLKSVQIEWRILCAERLNSLLEGPIAATDAALLMLQPHVTEPIVWNRTQALELPSGQTSALILRDVAHLSAGDQTRLLAWINGTGTRTQIVSTTEYPLFPLVAQGLFDEALYYRLNVMLLRVGSRHSPGLHADHAEHSRIGSPTTAPAPPLA